MSGKRERETSDKKGGDNDRGCRNGELEERMTDQKAVYGSVAPLRLRLLG